MNDTLLNTMTDSISFENGRTALTLDQLQRSARYQMANGKLPKTRPVEHFQLISELMEEADKHSLAPSLDRIIATERQTLRVNHEGNKDLCPLENLLFQRLVSRIHLGEKENDKNTAVALAFNEKGIQLAFGTNIQICSNQQIFGGNVMQTYGRQKVDFEKMLRLFKVWMLEFHNLQQQQFETIDQLDTIDIDHEEISSVTGDLFRRAVLSNAGETIAAPLNQAQVADFVKSQGNNIYDRGEQKTAWDLIQYGTHELKPERSDLVTLYDHNSHFCDYIKNRYLAN